MNFLQYHNATDFLKKTELSVEEGLRVVERELNKLELKKIKGSGGNETRISQ